MSPLKENKEAIKELLGILLRYYTTKELYELTDITSDLVGNIYGRTSHIRLKTGVKFGEKKHLLKELDDLIAIRHEIKQTQPKRKKPVRKPSVHYKSSKDSLAEFKQIHKGNPLCQKWR